MLFCYKRINYLEKCHSQVQRLFMYTTYPQHNIQYNTLAKMSSQKSKTCDASTQTPHNYPNSSEYSLTLPSNDCTVTLATAAIRVFTERSVLPPLRKRIKYDMDYLIAVKAAEAQRKRQARKLSESSEQSTDSWYRVPKNKTKSKEQKTTTTEDQESNFSTAGLMSPTRKICRPLQVMKEVIEPTVVSDYKGKIIEAKEGDKAEQLTIEAPIKGENIKIEHNDESIVELKEEEISEEQLDTPQLVSTKKPGKMLAIKNVVFQIKRPKILEKMSEEKALIIGKLLSEFKRHNMDTRQQTSDEFFQNVKIVKAKLKQILHSDDHSLNATYAPRRDYYYL